MPTGFVKLRRRRGRDSKLVAKKSIENRKKLSEIEKIRNIVLYDIGQLKNRNLSIITDDEPDYCSMNDVVSLSQRRLKKIDNHRRKDSDDSYVRVIVEKDVTPTRKKVEQKDIKESVKMKNGAEKYHGSKFCGAWYLKFRRHILKSRCNKVYPDVHTRDPARTLFSPKYTVHGSVCAQQDLAQNVSNGLPACIEPEQAGVHTLLFDTAFSFFPGNCYFSPHPVGGESSIDQFPTVCSSNIA